MMSNLMTAIANRNVNTVGNLVADCLVSDQGLDDSDAHGRTALMYAVANNWPEVVSLLLSSNADKDIMDSRKYTALQVAALHGYEKCLILLIPGSDQTELDLALIRACKWERSTCLRELLEAGADPCAIHEDFCPITDSNMDIKTLLNSYVIEHA